MDTFAKYRRLLGREVEVVIDRPIGSRHPKFDTTYETNYGYVEDTLAGDGMEIDAYVLGPVTPIKTFQGKCISIIFRLNDIEHKLVISNRVLSIEEIKASTNFVEQYFETSIELFEIFDC